MPKILLPPGFDPWTAQFVVNRYYRLPYLGLYFNYHIIIITCYVLILSVFEIMRAEGKGLADLSQHRIH